MRFTGIIALLALVSFSCKKKETAPLPIANFYVENNGCQEDCDVIFFDQSTNASSLFWDFGNGITSVKAIDTILYDTSGVFEVWLYATNQDGAKDSIRKSISINE